MFAQPRHRDKIVRTAAELFRRQGYAATGTNQIVSVSGAPKGSLYHYFPGGKEHIAQEAVTYAGERVRETLARLLEQESTPGVAWKAYGRLLGGWLGDSGFRDGCPITTTLLELAPASRPVTEAGRHAFDSWVGVLQDALVAAGADGSRARRLATLAVASLEGALVLARVQSSAAPVLETTTEVATLLDEAVR